MRLLLLLCFALARCTLQEEPQRCSWEERTLVDVKSRLRSGRQVRVRFNDGSTKIVDEADVIGMPGGPAALEKLSKPPPPQPAPRFTFIAMLAAVNLLMALVLLVRHLWPEARRRWHARFDEAMDEPAATLAALPPVPVPSPRPASHEGRS